ncbi:MAG: acetoacetate--CoA ligase [Gammaproteobacteria bacterium]|nr:acetoacetate--CoA ligase [Gammaproteobacteria bacterium]
MNESNQHPIGELLWQPDSATARKSNLLIFINKISDKYKVNTDYKSLHRWSTDQSPLFWAEIWEEMDVLGDRADGDVLENPGAMPGARWFPGCRLNFAENLLRFRDGRCALIFRSEGGGETSYSYRELHREVARHAAMLRALGVAPGDRVAGYMANIPETVFAMLAATALGATWSSCSPDFGTRGVLERFAQIGPRVLYCVDGYRYNGKPYGILDSAADVAAELPSLERVIVVPFLGTAPDLPDDARFTLLEEVLAPHGAAEEVNFVRMPFDHPLYILYSSGTTGAPKCIVHGAGGTLLQHLKEHRLHCDLRREDTLFFFSTCGWMMWNWLVSALATGCTLVLYDGSPFFPRRRSLWQMAGELGITVFGTSARYIAACAKAGLNPGGEYDLSALRAVLSTGSPLAPESFDYVYERIGRNLMLSSMSGGTDIVSCFVLGNPLMPVHRGEIQCPGLGMAVDVFGEDGPVRGERGELVCTRPFPSMPLGFWGEPDDSRFLDAYFSRFPGVWTQGDYAEITAAGGMVIYGRSDAVLNPGGVRIGTAEIYRQVEKLDVVLESLCIGQNWSNDVRIVLFVLLREGAELTEELQKEIRRVIRENASPRHVPAKIIAVPDIPRTLSGKIVELAVKNIVHGEPVRNTEALANPQALDHFRGLPELEEN